MSNIIVPYPVDELFALADAQDIEIHWYPFDESPRGRYFLAGGPGGQSAIFLAPALRRNPVDLRCVLAHELGHHFEGLSDYRADRWARTILIPDKWLLAHARWMSLGELAEEAGVYPVWVEHRLMDLGICQRLAG